MIVRIKTIDITFESIPDDLEIVEFTSFCEKRGYRPCFNAPIIGPSPKIRIYYNNEITSTPVSSETVALIINRPEGFLEFPEDRKPIEIKETNPFRIMNLILTNYPEDPSKRQIAEETCGILRASTNRNESIRGYYKDLRKIIGSDILPLNSRRFKSSVKIIEILR